MSESTPDDLNELKNEEQEPASLEYPSHQALENQLTALEHQIEAYEDKLKRAHAELDNIRRRAERDVSQAHKFGIERLLADLLPVMDSLQRAEMHETEDKHFKEGVSLTLTLFQKVLEKHGVASITPQPGDPFNPELHEAMSMQKNPDFPPNSIIATMQPGYTLNGRVIRAAMVVVGG